MDKSPKMKTTVLCLILLCVSASTVQASVYCSDDNWTLYKDEKCVKLFQTFQTRDAAEEECNQEFSTLVSLRSASEQAFLSELVFNESQFVSIWIGALRRLDGDSDIEFDWNDGSSVQRYTNWGIGRPSSDSSRLCVVMQSQLVRQFYDMPWSDVYCGTFNWFICEKLPMWSPEHFQQTFIESRRELEDNVNSFTSQVLKLDNDLTESRRDLKELQDNPVPIGFIYVQLSNHPEPSIIWPTVEWSEITNQYAGLFFRVAGEGSEAFGTIQNENSPRLTLVQGHSTIVGVVSNSQNIFASGIASGWISTGPPVNSSEVRRGLSFTVSGGEVRPRNTAIRIWTRTG